MFGFEGQDHIWSRLTAELTLSLNMVQNSKNRGSSLGSFGTVILSVIALYSKELFLDQWIAVCDI